MKMNTLFFLTVFTVVKCFCQKSVISTESVYSVAIKGELENLPSEINSDMNINAKLKVIRNNRFCILVIIESSLENPEFSAIAHSENEGDTLLFDKMNKLVYSFSEKKSYWYSENNIEQEDIKSDTIKKSDTVIVLSKTLNKQISPTPTLKEMSHGILSYSAKGFSFQYISSKTSIVSLEAIYNRCKNYIYTNKKTEFAY